MSDENKAAVEDEDRRETQDDTADSDWSAVASATSARLRGDETPAAPKAPLEFDDEKDHETKPKGEAPQGGRSATPDTGADIKASSQTKAAAPAVAEDWEGLSDAERRERFTSMVNEKRRAEHQARSERGRQAAYQKRISTLQQELEEARKVSGSPEDRPSKADIQKALIDPEKRKKIVEDFEELAPLLEAMDALEQRSKALDERVTQRPQAQAPAPVPETSPETAAGIEWLSENGHPDWAEILTDPATDVWIREQPGDAYRNAREHGDVNDVAWLLREYKRSTGQGVQPPATTDKGVTSEQEKASSKSADRLRDAVDLPAGRRSTPRSSGDDPDAWWAEAKAKADRGLRNFG